MKMINNFSKLSLISILVLFSACFNFFSKTEIQHMKPITSTTELKALFPKNPADIQAMADKALKQLEENVNAIIAIPNDQRTFANTAGALDAALDQFTPLYYIISIQTMVNPDAAMREAAQKADIKIGQATVDLVGQNKELYEAFKAYAEQRAPHEDLSDQQKYFLDESMKDFKRAGLHLPDETRNKVKALQKELTELVSEFDKNTNEDKSTITARKEELTGLDDEFLDTLKKNDDGLYILGVDYPTYFKVMENCTNADIRKKLYIAFGNRAYPENYPLLQKIAERKHKIAQLLGFESFAHLDLDGQMVQTPERATEFLDDLIAKARAKGQQEFELLTKDLPQSVTLSKDGKLQPWDSMFLKNYYKRTYLQVDEDKLAEYFPVEHTIEVLLDIYHRFLNVDFKEVAINGTWHNEVQLIEVSQDGQFLGYLLLDLYPRENKYSHACHAGLVSALKRADGSKRPVVGLVIANFPKATPSKPALLQRSDVSTFFHEFGHALHNILGATELTSQSGTSVKKDFVELPSQMLEEWLWDEEILTMVSKHYKTGEPLSKEQIKKIQSLKQLGTGMFVLGQAAYSKLALELYDANFPNNIDAIYKKIYESTLPFIEFPKDTHMAAAFGHLTNYYAKYYGYLWSKVFALDLFDHIKKHGLLNPEIGSQYVDKVIGKGGSQDPNELLVDFLGREPNNEAFLADMGL